MTNQEKTIEIINLCLVAGKIMLRSGAETYRVEDTMQRMALAFGMKEAQSYVTPTAIMFSAVDAYGQQETTRLVRIFDRTTDLKKVALVNDISRKISSGVVGLEDAFQQLKEIERADLMFPLWVQLLAASLASGCFLIMFKGIWHDFVPAMIAGAAGYYAFILFHKLIPVRFFAEFLAAIFIGAISSIFVHFEIGTELDKIIIGAVMPLVPGLLITNAVRDLMADHLVSGLSKGAEAFLTAFAIGSGIAVVLSFQ